MRKAPEKLVLCTLTDTVRLVLLDRTSFSLEICTEEGTWKAKYFYGGLGEALKGYVLYSLQKLGSLDESSEISELIQAVERLDATIKVVDAHIVDVWDTYASDPVEAALRLRQ